MRKIQKITEKTTVGYQYTTNDLVSFSSSNKKGLVSVCSGSHVILLDITEESSFMLMEFFRYVNTELKNDE